jgi:iron complex outermembrane receptor protein
MKINRVLLASSAMALIVAAHAGVAFSQVAAPSSTAGQDPDAPHTSLTEVVVTARKTSEKLVTAPLSVTALSANDLQARDIVDYEGLQNFAPGFKYVNQSVNRNDRGYTSFIMRGMNPGTPTSTEAGVSVFLDGVPLAGGYIDGMDDVQQVEVIKGPQSAYFGRSTFAGAVNFITKTPSFSPQAKVDVQYGSFNTYDLNGSVEGAIVKDVLSARLALRDYHTDGQWTNPEVPGKLGEQDTKSVSGTLYFTPTNNFNMKIYGKYFHDDDGPAATAYLQPGQYNCGLGTAATTGVNYVNGKNYFCGNIPQFKQASLGINTQIAPAMLAALNGQIPAFYITGQGFSKGNIESGDTQNALGLLRNGYTFHTTAHYQFDNGFALDANIGYDKDNYQFMVDASANNLLGTVNPNYAGPNSILVPGDLPYDYTFAHGVNEDVDASGEIRLTSPRDQRIRGMIGVSYYFQDTRASTLLATNSLYINAYNDNAAINKTPAIFGNITVDILHNLNLSFDGREQYDYVQSVTFANNASYSATFTSFSPRLILSYYPIPNTTLYASWSQGTRPGEFNSGLLADSAAEQKAILASAPIQLAVPEEHVTMYEIGVKSRFLDNRAEILAAVYYGDWTGRHIQDKVYFADPTNPSVLDNQLFAIAGGEVLLKGVELEGRFQVTPQFLVEGNFDYAGTNIRKDYCADCINIEGTPYVQGTSLPGYPTTSGTLAGTYTQPLWNSHNGFLRMEWVYTGVDYVDDSNVARLAPHSELNLHVGYDAGRYRIELFGNNITNTQYYLFGQRYSDSNVPLVVGSNLAPGTYNDISVSPGNKAMWGVHLTASF